MASIQIFRFLLNWLKHLKSYNGINSENIVFFPENYLRHIDSGDISLVNGKTEGIDGMMKTTFPLLHDFLFLFSECLICFALKHCSGMSELLSYAWYVALPDQCVNLSDCQSFTGQEYSSLNIVKALKEKETYFWNYSKGFVPWLTY